jgi:secreted PhoX family phosphatase
VTGHVLISLTNNKPKGNYYGSILKLAETNNDYESLSFTADTYLAGGEETGFACPDNMAFDPEGNLWFTSDISGSAMHKEPYTAFKNNGLFMVPRAGKRAGEVIQMASAPFDAELTGPWFAPRR